MSTIALTVLAVTVTTLVVVGWMSSRTISVARGRIQAYISREIGNKARELASNHALALSMLVEDNAFGAVEALVRRAAEDEDVVYGLFLSADGQPWAYVSPTRRPIGANADGRPPTLEEVSRELALSSAQHLFMGVKRRQVQLFGHEIAEASHAVTSAKGEFLGSIRYGLSTRRARQEQEAMRAAMTRDRWIMLGSLLLLGVAVTVVSVSLASGAAHRITQPLGDLTTAANALAAGQRSVQVQIETDDELAWLGEAFNQMVRELLRSQHGLEALNRTLEDRVQERTAELAARNEDMRLVLDNVDQGLLTVTRSGRLTSQRSAVVDRWFGAYDESASFVDYIRRADPRFSDWFDIAFEELIADSLPQALAVDQLPKRLRAEGREYDVSYIVLERDEQVRGLLVRITDLTDALAHERMEGEQRELMCLFQAFTRDRKGLQRFLGETERLLEGLASRDPDSLQINRAVHTLKGNAGVVGLHVIARLCHELEEALAQGDERATADRRARLVERWHALRGHMEELLAGQRPDAIEISRQDYERFLSLATSLPSAAPLVEEALRWKLEPLEAVFERFAAQAKLLAERLGKGAVVIQTAPGGVMLDPELWAPFWSDFVHVVRNAIDHGIETGAERAAAGKPGPPRLRLSGRRESGALVLTVEDNGRGIDWAAIAARAAASGLPHATPAELRAALFAPGFTTVEEATLVSGRGLGLDVIRRRTEELGGTIELDSQPGLGTTWRFRFPTSSKLGPPALVVGPVS